MFYNLSRSFDSILKLEDQTFFSERLRSLLIKNKFELTFRSYSGRRASDVLSEEELQKEWRKSVWWIKSSEFPKRLVEEVKEQIQMERMEAGFIKNWNIRPSIELEIKAANHEEVESCLVLHVTTPTGQDRGEGKIIITLTKEEKDYYYYSYLTKRIFNHLFNLKLESSNLLISDTLEKLIEKQENLHIIEEEKEGLLRNINELRILAGFVGNPRRYE